MEISEETRKRVEDFKEICKTGEAIFAEKNTDYGDSIRFGGVLAACYEIVGAAMRLPKLVFFSSDHGRAKTEKIYDVLLDIHNYAAIALIMMKENNWEGKF